MAGRLLVISGPSGAGKDTILAMFRSKYPDWAHPVSFTTRSPRSGEVDGEDMNFITRDQFEAWIDAGKFLEWFETADNLYGTLRRPIEELLQSGKNIVLRKDVRGAVAIKKALPQATIVIIVPDNEENLEKHLRVRAKDSEEVISKRLEISKRELAYKDQFDHVIVNPEGHPERALSDLEKILGL